MYKARGTLQRQELGKLEQVEIISGKPADTTHATPPLKAKEKPHKPKKRRELHFVLIACALILLLVGGGSGVVSQSIDSGNIAVDDLTAIHVTLNVNST
ncbi:MAG: hypothetical protein IJO80_05125, partial [Firmicutes bacterium]|nr:hypothetical protein [Bacillota bacterium]